MPKLHIVPVDETTGGFDGGVIVGTIHPNRPNEAAVRPNDICMIDGHLGLQVARTLAGEFEETELDLLFPSSKDRTRAEKVNGKAYKFEGDRGGLF